MLNVVIYDNSRADRLKLERIIRSYAKMSNIELGSIVSTGRPIKILELSLPSSALYLLNIDDLEKTMDGIELAAHVRANDLNGSIVFLSERYIAPSLNSDLVVRSIKRHVAAMAFLGKDSDGYEKELEKCIAAHIRKMFYLSKEETSH